MSNLKELLQEQHTNAERQAFVKVLMSGKINPKLYATYLWNQHKKYDLLEALADVNGVLQQLPNIRRKQRIEADFNELWNESEPPTIVQSTHEYIMHLKNIMNDPQKLMAHIYVLHMGDLSGGQMISRKVPGKGLMYQFEGDIATTKDKIRAMTNDGMAEEAAFVFESATKLFKELMELEIEHFVESPDTVSE